MLRPTHPPLSVAPLCIKYVPPMRSWTAMRLGGVGAENRKRVVEMRRLRSQPKPLFKINPYAVLSPESTLENKVGGRAFASSEFI